MNDIQLTVKGYGIEANLHMINLTRGFKIHLSSGGAYIDHLLSYDLLKNSVISTDLETTIDQLMHELKKLRS